MRCLILCNPELSFLAVFMHLHCQLSDSEEAVNIQETIDSIIMSAFSTFCLWTVFGTGEHQWYYLIRCTVLIRSDEILCLAKGKENGAGTKC